jgi:DNA-directed RNA polymerase subunit L
MLTYIFYRAQAIKSFINNLLIQEKIMDIKIIEQSKKKMVFELPGVDHTFCNILKEELNKDDNVKVATYTIAHPLVRVPKFIVETKGDKEPTDTLKSAVKRIGKLNEDFLSTFKKAK